MNNSKKVVIFMFSLTVLVLTGVIIIVFINKTMKRELNMDSSLGEIQAVLVEHLKEKNISIEAGTAEYDEYITEQLVGDDLDEDLTKRADYAIIRAYMVAYFNASSDWEYEQRALCSDEAVEIPPFVPSEEFLRQTVNEIAERNKK